MKQRTKDVYLIPFCIGIVLLLVGLPLSAWYTKQPVRTIVTWTGIKGILFAKVYAWTDVFFLLLVVVLLYLLYRLRQTISMLRAESASLHETNLKLAEHIQQMAKKPEADVEKSKVGKPEIHVAWDKMQSFWGLGTVGDEPCIQIGGWAHMSASDAKEEIIITDAYLEGTESRKMLPVKIHPNFARHQQLFTYVSPVIAKAGQPLKTKLILVDHKNRKYILDEHTFRFIGSQQQIDEALEAGREEPKPYWS